MEHRDEHRGVEALVCERQVFCDVWVVRPLRAAKASILGERSITTGSQPSCFSSTLVGLFYSCCGGWRGILVGLMGWWQVVQRPVQHLKRGWSSRTAWGRVRPATGDLGSAAPG